MIEAGLAFVPKPFTSQALLEPSGERSTRPCAFSVAARSDPHCLPAVCDRIPIIFLEAIGVIGMAHHVEILRLPFFGKRQKAGEPKVGENEVQVANGIFRQRLSREIEGPAKRVHRQSRVGLGRIALERFHHLLVSKPWYFLPCNAEVDRNKQQAPIVERSPPAATPRLFVRVRPAPTQSPAAPRFLSHFGVDVFDAP